MKLSSLIKGLNYKILQGDIEVEINHVQCDSRRIREGDLFICIAGMTVDGHLFIDEAIDKKASVIITEKNITKKQSVTIIQTENTGYLTGIIYSRYYGEPSRKLKVIGITGTKGKTTTTYMIQNMLNRLGCNTGLMGTIEVNYNDIHYPLQNTTPEPSVLHRYLREMVDASVEAVVMEVSSQGLMLDRVAGVDFDYGIFTNISEDHIGKNEHKSFDEYLRWKAKLFSLCKVGIINRDCHYSSFVIDNAKCPVFTYGKDNISDYRAYNPSLYFSEGRLGIKYMLTGNRKDIIEVGMPGEFSMYNSLAAVSLLDLMGKDIAPVKDALKSLCVKGRVEVLDVSTKFTVIIDYAHNALSLESLLISLREYRPDRIITIFGCGGNRDRGRRFKMGNVSARLSDLTILTNDNPRYEEPMDIISDIIKGIEEKNGNYLVYPERKEAIRKGLLMAREGDILVLAGKGHENYQDIQGVKYPMDERALIREILEEEDVTKICGYNNRYFA